MKERHDLKRWVLYTNRHLAAKNKDIFLCGISMGCATTLMAAGLDLTDNVKELLLTADSLLHGYHQTRSQRKISSSTISINVHGRFDQ